MLQVAAFCGGAPLPISHPTYRGSRERCGQTPRCGSLEDSKKRAKSPYDNIPDVNQLYLRELDALKRQGRIPADTEPASGSILRPEGVLSTRQKPYRPRQRPDSRRGAAVTDADHERVDGGAEVALGAEAERARAVAQEQSVRAYNELRRKLLSDTAFIAALAVCGGWAFGDATTAASIGLGSIGSFAYVFLLGRGVDRIGKSADVLGPARAAVLALLVAFSAKHRDTLQVLPVMLGFFTYKVATLLPLLTGEAFEELSDNSGRGT